MSVRVQYRIGEHPPIGSDRFGALTFDGDFSQASDIDVILLAAQELWRQRPQVNGDAVSFRVLRRPPST